MVRFVSYILCVLSIVCLVVGVSAQITSTLVGTVADAASGKPLQFVNVYFDNTTIGSSTDSTGQFVIRNATADQTELTFSSVGYRTLKVPNLDLTTGEVITVHVKMVPMVVRLAPITIQASRRRDWSSKYTAFKKIFLGTTANATKTEILNPGVISFEDIEGDGGHGHFKAKASEPVEIENRALGYRLSVSLVEFEFSDSSYNIVANTRFDALIPKSRLQEQRWRQNRVDVYKGSQLHLFRSIANGSYLQEGFRIFIGSEVQKYLPASLEDLVVDSTRSSLKILRKGIYKVEYRNKIIPLAMRESPDDYFPVSIIRVDDEYLNLHTNGQAIQPANYLRSGYLYDFRFADFLPANYNQVIDEGELTLSDRRERVALHGTVIDKNGEPVNGAEVFINKGLNQATTNAWGQFELGNLYPGKYEVVFVSDEMQEVVRVVDLSNLQDRDVVVELKEKSVRKLSEMKPVDRELMNAHILRFWNLLFKDMKKWDFVITNPQAIQFAKQPKQKESVLWTTAPLIIENQHLGLRWTYYVDGGTMHRQNLHITGLIKMDTLQARSDAQRYRWLDNRLEGYQGSWSHLIASLVEGRSESEGFHFYRARKDIGQKKAKFSKLLGSTMNTVDPDSILLVDDGRLALNVLPGLEVHNANKKAAQRRYKDVNNQVLRFDSDSSVVTISRTGSIDPADLKVLGQPTNGLPTVPIDCSFYEGKITDPNVLLYVQDENLKAIKNLLEKVYVQTDKQFYFPGDTIWFKAYFRYSNLKYRDSLSNLLYADLLDPQGKLLSNAIVKIKNGDAWGDITLNNNLPPGDYYLRAYTSWMQNFDEYAIRPLPIISRGSFIEPEFVDSASNNPDGLRALLIEKKSIYGTRENIELTLKVTRDDRPVDGAFSISVTDQSVVSDIANVPNIFSINEPFSAEDARIIGLSYPIEHGITIRGRIPGAKPQSEYLVTTVLLNGEKSIITPVIGEEFSLVLDFFDTTTALLQCVNRSQLPADIELVDRPPVRSYRPPPPLLYHLKTDDAYVKNTKVSGERTRLLQEVTVSAKHIPNPQENVVTTTQARLGMVYKAIQGKDLSAVRESGNLLNFLSAQDPQFGETYQLIVSGAHSDFSASRKLTVETDRDGDTNISQSAPSDNLPISIYRFYLNGQPISPIDFNVIPANLVSRIEVYWVSKVNYQLAIYTEPSFPYSVHDFEYYNVRGYDRPRKFFEPPRESLEPDYRSTIYWNPNIEIGSDGQAPISFRASDVDGTYKVTIEGVADGEFFRITKYLLIGISNDGSSN